MNRKNSNKGGILFDKKIIVIYNQENFRGMKT